MAKRYSVASPSTGTGAANVLYAGGGGARARSIPKAAPRGLSIDLGLDKMREKGEDDAKRKYLIEGGLDPRAVSLMDTQSLDMGVRAMSDDLIAAEGKRSEVADAEIIGKFFQDLEKAKTGSSGDGNNVEGLGELHDEFGGTGTGKEFAEWFETPEGQASFEDDPNTIVKEPDPAEMPEGIFDPMADEAPVAPVDALSSLLQGLPSRLVTKEIAGAVRQAQMDVTPKEVDPLTHSTSMRVGDRHISWDRYGKEWRNIDLSKYPDDIEWQEVKGWIGDKQGSFFRDKDNPNVYIMDGKEPKFHPVPEGFSRVRPRSEKSLSMKFNAFLEMNDDYKGLIPAPKVLLDPKDLYLNGNAKEQKAAIEFFKTEDGAVALIKELRKLTEARNKGDDTRSKRIEELIKQKEGR